MKSFCSGLDMYKSCTDPVVLPFTPDALGLNGEEQFRSVMQQMSEADSHESRTFEVNDDVQTDVSLPRLKISPARKQVKSDISHILDCIPFTPSQGVCTPSPRSSAVRRSTSNAVSVSITEDFRLWLSLTSTGLRFMPLLAYAPVVTGFNVTRRSLTVQKHMRTCFSAFIPVYSCWQSDNTCIVRA
jgi:hypothetical protein